jgi:hypothetical protein
MATGWSSIILNKSFDEKHIRAKQPDLVAIIREAPRVFVENRLADRHLTEAM